MMHKVPKNTRVPYQQTPTLDKIDTFISLVVLLLGIILLIILFTVKPTAVVEHQQKTYYNPANQEQAFNSLIEELAGEQEKIVPTKQTVSVENFKKTKSCLMRNVFYEGPRYSPGREKHFGVSRAELEEHIILERIRIINVTLNRVNSPKFSGDICDVIYQFKQFSWTLDEEKRKNPLYAKYEDHDIEMYNIRQIEKIVVHALTHGFEDLTGGAMYYHTHEVSPYWKRSKTRLFASNWHIYYKDKKHS